MRDELKFPRIGEQDMKIAEVTDIQPSKSGKHWFLGIKLVDDKNRSVTAFMVSTPRILMALKIMSSRFVGSTVPVVTRIRVYGSATVIEAEIDWAKIEKQAKDNASSNLQNAD